MILGDWGSPQQAENAKVVPLCIACQLASMAIDALHHEGDRAEDMIKTLDFQKIIDSSPLDLEKLIGILK